MKLCYFFLLTLLVVSCNNDTSENDADVDLQAELDALNEELNDLEEVVEEGWREYFDLNVPEFMFEADNLNSEAIAQYSFIEKVELDSERTEVREHYLIVLMEEKDSIADYSVDVNAEIQSYLENAISTIRKGERTESLTILSESAEVEEVNGIPALRAEMLAEIDHHSGTVELYYQLGVYEGKRAFYQVVTWCLGGQKDLFKVDMEKILDSFQEK